MSDAFRSVSRHPVGRPVMIVTWGFLTAHLFGLVPQSADPIHLALVRAKSRKVVAVFE